MTYDHRGGLGKERFTGHSYIIESTSKDKRRKEEIIIKEEYFPFSANRRVDEHDLFSAVRDLASTLGTTPESLFDNVKREPRVPTVLDREFDIAEVVTGDGMTEEMKAGVVELATMYRDEAKKRIYRQSRVMPRTLDFWDGVTGAKLEEVLEKSLTLLGQQNFVELVKSASSPLNRIERL